MRFEYIFGLILTGKILMKWLIKETKEEVSVVCL